MRVPFMRILRNIYVYVLFFNKQISGYTSFFLVYREELTVMDGLGVMEVVGVSYKISIRNWGNNI